ncbi:class I SAM-dependent methyltransferase [Dactylosporangium sp. NPDC048998]|uniref:class I SAM-dependent methyltransferase n=1 Tax=Dactylosporangium sp. NPDC048998 TaxID=3363976 RepID=UPI0037172CD1
MTDTNTSAAISRTALMAAAARAAHLIVDDEPYVFEDPLAVVLLGDRADELLAYHRLHGEHPVLSGARAQVLCRSRYAEDTLHRSFHSQYVILGAGLDSYANRGGDDVRVFEVDRAATQEFKRAALRAAGLPERAAYVAVDFERDDLLERLVAHGFDPLRPAVVSWLGVTMYLTREAVERTVAGVARLGAGTVLVLDHMVPEEDRDPAARAYVEAVGSVNAQHGEPWLSFFSPAGLAAMLGTHGMSAEHTNQHEILGARTDALQPSNLTWITRGTVSP